jgi:hypothetical protein
MTNPNRKGDRKMDEKVIDFKMTLTTEDSEILETWNIAVIDEYTPEAEEELARYDSVYTRSEVDNDQRFGWDRDIKMEIKKYIEKEGL